MASLGEIRPHELKHRLDRGDRLTIVDVREPEEVAFAQFPGAIHIPIRDIPSRLDELQPESEIVVVCHHGIRSAQVAAHLAGIGFERVWNLTGGIDQWSISVDPGLRRY